MKTNKSYLKRIKVTKNGKFLKRAAGQDHFNARESGKTTKNKRRSKDLHSTTGKQIQKLMPYSF